ncbi:MAG TPA: GGDEF domain-containing protein [Planctomycetes bacterium]|nr:GGDEF domain-containing protein [Planctomycetota bacterium]HIN80087.1 GGDEF domain-containing protein [Planctomycetota bacterium]
MSNIQRFRELEGRGIDVVELLAGDCTLDSGEFVDLINSVKSAGPELYTDLIQLLTHRRIPAPKAEKLWRGVLKHKRKLEGRLGRNPGVRVAALDYFQNLRGLLDRARIVGRKEFETLLSQVSVDELTGLNNRRAILSTLRWELQRSRRYSKEFTLLLIDLDRLKSINDSHGHAAGDRVLIEVGRRIEEVCRETDSLGRYGGDELLMVLPETRARDASIFIDRLRRRVGKEVVSLDEEGGEWLPSISVGAATYPRDGKNPEELLRVADNALYSDKGLDRSRSEPPGGRLGDRLGSFTDLEGSS